MSETPADLYADHLSGWGSSPWCHACQSRTVRWHCADRGCRMVRCLKCMAETAEAGGRLAVVAMGVERL
jgi:hypothetical protein